MQTREPLDRRLVTMVDATTHQWLKEYAYERHVSMGDVVRFAIQALVTDEEHKRQRGKLREVKDRPRSRADNKVRGARTPT
jgi:hypothetical protein